MSQMASVLHDKNFILRSGAAIGADTAFEEGCRGRKEIFIPWTSYSRDSTHQPIPYRPNPQAEITAEAHHPNWSACTPAVRKLLIRNVYILLGMDLNMPVEFVICWTLGASIKGGTGHTIKIAQSRRIPVFNLAAQADYESLLQHLKGL